MTSPTDATDEATVETLARETLPVAERICARAMRDNPTHRQAFGVDPAQRRARLARFFSVILSFIHQNGTLVVARVRGEPVGVAGVLPPSACRPSGYERLRLSGSVLRVCFSHSLRIWRWLGTWSRHDPTESHWHVGPVAVLPRHQGSGIGTRLMTRILASAAEHDDAPAYLETDRESNVRFYQRLGFTVAARLPVLGVPNWFMRCERGAFEWR